MSQRYWLSSLVVAVLSFLSVSCYAVGLKEGHPDRYVVVRGDTLWDISTRFLTEPWRWPEIWRANPQIRNPHLIYPGDEVYVKGGQVYLRRAGNRTVKLSPRMRVTQKNGAIPAIPLDAIQQFLSHPRVALTEAEFEAAPYIVSVGREALIARPDSEVFARGIDSDQHRRFAVYRPGQEFFNPGIDGAPDEVLGYEGLHVGDAVLERAGDPATMRLVNATREVRGGDRLYPVVDEDLDFSFMPHTPAAGLEGRILSVIDGVNQIGQYQVVVINLGRREGIETGHVMAVYRRGETVVDPYTKPPLSTERPHHIELDPAKQGGFDGFTAAVNQVLEDIGRGLKKEARKWNPNPAPDQLVTLPDQRAGTLMVFRPFERVSYALMMEATRAMHVDDPVRTP